MRSAFESAQQVLRVDPDPKAASRAVQRCSHAIPRLTWILRMADCQSIYHPFWIPLIIILSLYKSSIVYCQSIDYNYPLVI